MKFRKCRSYGFVAIGDKALEVCPVCNPAHSYLEINVKNDGGCMPNRDFNTGVAFFHQEVFAVHGFTGWV